MWRRLGLALPLLGARHRINEENEENGFRFGSQIDWPWKQREDSKRTSWWACIQKSLEVVWEGANV